MAAVGLTNRITAGSLSRPEVLAFVRELLEDSAYDLPQGQLSQEATRRLHRYLRDHHPLLPTVSWGYPGPTTAEMMPTPGHEVFRQLWVVIAGGWLSRLKRCARCGRWFADVSRNRRTLRCGRLCTDRWWSRERRRAAAPRQTTASTKAKAKDGKR